jgi:hypothetical protein
MARRSPPRKVTYFEPVPPRLHPSWTRWSGKSDGTLSFKLLAAGYSADEKAKLFSGTAKRVYRLGSAA